ncbi:MAG: ATP-grasp domain-containing protein [Thermoleophilaceae bacterium]|nr:ATP-grasp domain-containing protein [Thermoleophilaceae bacterium]
MSDPRPINKLLVANRGEIARRVLRSCNELGIATVVVYSEADHDAMFVREADESICIGGPAPADSYLRGDAIIEAAQRTGADAIHPGYGFLAENAAFAQAVSDAGLIWIGPPPAAIDAMGSKINARERMQNAGVPVLPGVTLSGDGTDELDAAVAEIGFPLLAKASAGGGGKGLRLIREGEDVQRAVEAAQREAESAFGDGAIFLERYVEAPRHVEIQIFGDTHGNVVSLFERECSIQRRHQKVIEESPSPVVDQALRERMGSAAVEAGKAIGYVGAGTVEFLLAPEGDFFFLEVNTRLQVEHPVTEFITGLDLVRLQILVAEGAPLPAEALEPTITGHAIEARLCAEDPENDLLPVTGLLERFDVPANVRVDTGVASGSEISVHYDPMIAKVIAYAPTRAEAARVLADALTRAQLHGLVTNRDMLVRILRHPEFIAGQTDTHFLERNEPVELGRPLLDEQATELHIAAAAMAQQAENRAAAKHWQGLPSGWRNNTSQDQQISYNGAYGDVAVAYRFDRAGRLAALTLGERTVTATLHYCDGQRVELEADGLRSTYFVRRGSGEGVYVNSAAGQASLRELPRYPTPEDENAAGSLVSPMPGAVIRVLVEAGASVEAGDPLVVIEAMKMEHEIVAPATGTVTEVLVAQGDQVESGAELAVIDVETS